MTYQKNIENSTKKIKEVPVELSEPIVPGLSKDEYEAIRSNALSNAKNVVHHFRQRGPWIRCITCENSHGAWVGTHVRMIGEKEDGTPIFEKVLTAKNNNA